MDVVEQSEGKYFLVTINDVRKIICNALHTYEHANKQIIHKIIESESPFNKETIDKLRNYIEKISLAASEAGISKEDVNKMQHNLHINTEKNIVYYFDEFAEANNIDNTDNVELMPVTHRKYTSEDLRFTNPESFSDAFVSHVSEHKGGISDDEAKALKAHSIKFLEDAYSEEFKVLRAVNVLRDQFRLTPKPPIKWSERKGIKTDSGREDREINGKKISETTVGDVLGDYTPEHGECPDRDTPLATLTVHDWWNAFYKDDADAGRIAESNLRDSIDNSFRMKARREGVSSFAPADIGLRFGKLGEVLGGSPSRARTFTNHGGKLPAEADSRQVSTVTDNGVIQGNSCSLSVQ